MSGVNKAILIGNVGNDPEVKEITGGTTIANLTVATSEKYKGEEKTEWHRCVAFNNVAGIIRDYVKKGSKIYIEGKLQTRSWEQDGVKKYATEILVNNMQMLDSKQGGAPSRPTSNHPTPKQIDEFDDQEIPF